MVNAISKDSMTDPLAIPTLAEIEQAMIAWYDTHGYKESVEIVRRLRDLLTSGEVALVSRADREQALERQYRAAHMHSKFSLTQRGLGDELAVEARTLLQLGDRPA